MRQDSKNSVDIYIIQFKTSQDFFIKGWTELKIHIFIDDENDIEET